MNDGRWDERSQYRTWGTAYTGTTYPGAQYLPPSLNDAPPNLRARAALKIGLICVYALWASVIFEVGFYVGRWYEGRP